MPPLKSGQEKLLDTNLFNAGEVSDCICEIYPDSGVDAVPYSAEDGAPRVLLGRFGSYCSLELPISVADLLYHSTLLIVFGNQE